jgi:hypothetical protein
VVVKSQAATVVRFLDEFDDAVVHGTLVAPTRVVATLNVTHTHDIKEHVDYIRKLFDYAMDSFRDLGFKKELQLLVMGALRPLAQLAASALVAPSHSSAHAITDDNERCQELDLIAAALGHHHPHERIEYDLSALGEDQEEALDQMFDDFRLTQTQDLPAYPIALRAEVKLFDHQVQGIRWLIHQERMVRKKSGTCTGSICKRHPNTLSISLALSLTDTHTHTCPH